MQTKETLTSRPASFGSKAELSDESIKKIFKSAITENVLSFAAFKQVIPLGLPQELDPSY